MDDKEFHKIIKRYLNGKSTPEEASAVEEFYNRNQDKELFDKLPTKDKEQLREKVRSKVWDIIRDEEYLEKKEAKKSFPKKLAIAASVLLVITFGVIFILQQVGKTQNLITKTTTRGQKSTITLTDGSQVRLNSESSLIYPERFEENVRSIQLVGEAFFDVARDENRPFIIKSGEVTTTVLGTSFNVSAFPDEDIEVTVATGKVKVSPSLESNSPFEGGSEGLAGQQGDVKSQILLPGQQATFDPSTKELSKQKVNIEQFISWKEGIILFDDIPLSKAVKSLERWYNVEITFESEELGECYIQGRYQGEKLINILESLKFVKGIAYEFQKDGKILITGTECKN